MTDLDYPTVYPVALDEAAPSRPQVVKPQKGRTAAPDVIAPVLMASPDGALISRLLQELTPGRLRFVDDFLDLGLLLYKQPPRVLVYDFNLGVDTRYADPFAEAERRGRHVVGRLSTLPTPPVVVALTWPNFAGLGRIIAADVLVRPVCVKRMARRVLAALEPAGAYRTEDEE